MLRFARLRVETAATARLVAAQTEMAVPGRPRVLAADKTLAQVQLLPPAFPAGSGGVHN